MNNKILQMNPGDIVPDFLLSGNYFVDKNITFKIDVIIEVKIIEDIISMDECFLYPNTKSIKHYADFFNVDIPFWGLSYYVKVYTDPPGLKWRILNGC